MRVPTLRFAALALFAGLLLALPAAQAALQYIITISPQPAGGSIVLDPYKTGYQKNNIVTVTARPAEGYSFAGWGGDLSCTQNPTKRMIVDRAQVQLARETGVRVDDGTVNAAIGRVAESNGLSVPALRQRLEADGLSFNQFRDDIRQDIILSRLREREVDNRIQISDRNSTTSLRGRPASPPARRK